MSVLRCIAGLLVAGMFAGVAFSQDYPNKTIRIITGTAGGGSDFDARQIAQGISGPLGQPVVVENRPPILVGEAGAKAPPDGYTLFISGAAIWIVPQLQNMPYDAVRDFAPITLIEMTPSILTVHSSVPVKTVKELVALAKAKPGVLNYASGTPAGSINLAVELFKLMAGANITKISYKGTAPALNGLVAGEADVIILDVGLVMPHVKSGRLRALAVTSLQPSALAPGMPTVSASGVPGYEYAGMSGIWAPAKTPPAVITRLNQEIVRFVNRPEIKERFLNTGVEVVGNSPEQFAAIIKADIPKWSKVIKEANIKAD